MGRRRTSVTTLNQRMLDVGSFKYSGQLAISEWIWSNTDLGISLDSKSLSDYFIEYHQNSLPKKWDKLYRWASKQSRYFYGLPTSTLIHDPNKQYIDATIKYLNQLYNGMQVLHSSIDEVDFYYSTWFRLVNDFGYDSKTNELTVLSKQHKQTCYLKEGYLELSQRTYDEFIESGFINPTLSFGYHQIPFLDRYQDIDTASSDVVVGITDKAVITYTYEVETLPDEPLQGYIEPIKTIYEEVLEIDLSDINPELVDGQDIPSDSQSVFITYLYNDAYHWFSYEIGSGLITQIDTALTGSKVLGQYYPRVYIKHDSIEVYNHYDKPRKKATLKALKLFGLDAKELTQSMAKSIGDEYGNVRSIYLHMGVKVNWATNDSILSEYCFRYFDRLLDYFEQGMAGAIRVDDVASWQQYSWKGIYKQEHQGVISNAFGALKPNEYCTKLKEDFSTKPFMYEHTFYHQVTDDTYVSITVKELVTVNWVCGYSATFYAGNEHLILPIDRSLIYGLTKKEREYLYHHSLMVNILHVKVTKKKWYQTGLFQAVLFVAGVAISVLSGGTASAGAMAIVRAVAVAIAKGIITTLAVQLALRLAVKLGLNVAQIAVLAVVLQAVLSAYGGGRLDFSKILTAPNMMRAINQSFDFYYKSNMAQIADMYKQLQDLELQRQDRLNQAQRLLDTKVFTPSDELLKSNFTPQVNLFDTVEMFYSRHYGFNVIGISHGLIHNFVSGTLEQREALYMPDNQDIDDVLLIQ